MGVRGHKEMVELLIAKGAEVNARNGKCSVLYVAKALGHEEIADLLRQHGAKE
jgi:ankyrin repeat protein